MTVTELALLRLKPGVTPEDPFLRASLIRAKDAMESFTGNEFYYYQQVGDPSLIYILGSWASVEQHMNEFIPSEQNQAILTLLEDQVDVLSLLHVGLELRQLPLDWPILGIQVILAHHWDDVEAALRRSGSTYGPDRVAMGLRLDPELQGSNEYVRFEGVQSGRSDLSRTLEGGIKTSNEHAVRYNP